MFIVYLLLAFAVGSLAVLGIIVVNITPKLLLNYYAEGLRIGLKHAAEHAKESADKLTDSEESNLTTEERYLIAAHIHELSTEIYSLTNVIK